MRASNVTAFLCAQGIIPIANNENEENQSSASTSGLDGNDARQQVKKRKRREQGGSANGNVIDIDSDSGAVEEEVRKLKVCVSLSEYASFITHLPLL